MTTPTKDQQIEELKTKVASQQKELEWQKYKNTEQDIQLIIDKEDIKRKDKQIKKFKNDQRKIRRRSARSFQRLDSQEAKITEQDAELSVQFREIERQGDQLKELKSDRLDIGRRYTDRTSENRVLNQRINELEQFLRDFTISNNNDAASTLVSPSDDESAKAEASESRSDQQLPSETTMQDIIELFTASHTHMHQSLQATKEKTSSLEMQLTKLQTTVTNFHQSIHNLQAINVMLAESAVGSAQQLARYDNSIAQLKHELEQKDEELCYLRRHVQEKTWRFFGILSEQNDRIAELMRWQCEERFLRLDEAEANGRVMVTKNTIIGLLQHEIKICRVGWLLMGVDGFDRSVWE
jgi:hypothetical protein